MKASVFTDEEDGLWHIHCGECAVAHKNWCAGKYSDREAALSNAASHMRVWHGK